MQLQHLLKADEMTCLLLRIGIVHNHGAPKVEAIASLIFFPLLDFIDEIFGDFGVLGPGGCSASQGSGDPKFFCDIHVGVNQIWALILCLL